LGRSLAASVACLLLVAVAGCGAPEGVAENATVVAYVSAPLCADAKQELFEQGSRAGDVRVRAVCVDDSARASGSRLAAIGAAARRASEDSSSVAYLGSADPVAVRFSETILEEAGIARVASASGAAAMRKLLQAIQGSGDAGSLREAVYDRLG
jgi:hypothetical protein